MYTLLLYLCHTNVYVSEEARHQFVRIMTNKAYRIMYSKWHNNCSTIVVFFTTNYNKLAIVSIHGKYVRMYR